MSETRWITDGVHISPDTLAKRLIAVTQEFRKKGKSPNLLAQIMFQVAKVPEMKAKEVVPHETGRLRNAIKKKRDRNPQYENATENYQVYVYPGRKRSDEKGAWYWTFVHFATEKNPSPTPFLTIAFESTKDQMLQVFIQQFQNKIELAEKRVQKIK